VIEIDDRIGSKDLIRFFSPEEAQLCRLQYGDAAFSALQGDDAWYIGIERKRLMDLVRSILSGRLSAGQLPGMQAYYHVLNLVVEGVWRQCPETGILQTLRGSWTDIQIGRQSLLATSFWSMLNTLTFLGGLHIVNTHSSKETATWIKTAEKWWNSDKHRSHEAAKHTKFSTAPLMKPSLMRRIAVELPGIGVDRSKAVEKHFLTVYDMISSTDRRTWCEIEGIGRKTADKIVKAITEISGGSCDERYSGNDEKRV